MRALADALDDQLVQTTLPEFEHLDTVDDDDLKWLKAAADVPAAQVGKWVDMSLFYVGKQSPDGQ